MSTVVKMPKVFFDAFVTLVEEDDRMDFLPWLMDENVYHGLAFESFVYQTADGLSPSYNGGYWDYVKTKKNIGGLMMCNENESYEVENHGNYSSAVVDGRIFGLIASIIVASNASFQFYESKPDLSKKMADLYHSLRDSFYATVDALAFKSEESDYQLDIDVTDEEIEQIKLMSNTVWKLLD